MTSPIGGDIPTAQALGLMTPMEGADLRLGQRIAARVVEMLDGGDILLELGQSRAVVSAANSSLRPGDRVVLEVVVGGAKPEFRISTDRPGTSPQLSAGQRLEAQVLQLLPSGDVLLAFGQSRAVVSTSDPLQAGDRVILEVISGGARPELRIVTDSTGAAPPPVAGQRLDARVLGMLPSGNVLLEFGQSRAEVPTSVPLEPGEHVVLEVVTVGVQPGYRIVTGAAAPNPPLIARDTPAGQPPAAGNAPPGEPRVAGSAPVGELPVAGNAPAGQPPAVGQQLEARVLEARPNGDVLLLIGQDRAVLSTSSPLQQGDRVAVEVVTVGVQPEYRIVTDSPTAAPQPSAEQLPNSGFQRVPDPPGPRDLPVIMRALADVTPGTVAVADALQVFLRAAPALEMRPAVMEQIQRLAVPLDAALQPDALAVMIRTFLAQSGLFTENRLHASLKTSPLAAKADPHQADSDLRLLLGQLTTAGTPVPDAVRRLGEALLQQQLVVAERLAGTGVGQVSIPVMFGQQRVDVMFQWEREARQEKQDRPDRGMAVAVFVSLPALGAIEARAELKPDSLAVTFYVEREATRALVEAGLAGFSEQLSRAGCPAVTANVWLNPGRMASVAAAVTKPVRGGTILDVIA
jgi:Flagellar hook-length control protein FliK